MWFVYFIELSNGTIYVGSTGDLKRRLALHNAGKVKSTAPYMPMVLKAYVAVESRPKAVSLEKYFKSGSGKAVAKKRILQL